MKIIYSHLQKLLPSLKKHSVKKIANKLTMLGHFNDSLEYKDNEKIIGLEIRQNRGECLSYYGIATDLSVLYSPLNLDKIALPKINSDYQLPIKVSTPKNIHRIQAIRISKLKNSLSPNWLKKFLKLHDINPINTIVDLTNYIMLLYGIPCHAFDTKKSGDKLIWELNNNKYKQFITLDGTKLQLNTNTLMVNNSKKALSLSFLGGQACAIDLSTKEVIIEMAVYNRLRVRKDSKSLKTITKASIRLDKFLDTKLIPLAFNHLTQLILKNCNGQISGNLYEYYPKKPKPIEIKFNPKKVSQYAGVNISPNFSLDILKKLGCKITPYNPKQKLPRHSELVSESQFYLITPPSIRKDINIEEDLIEEVIRYYGYNKIPINKPISNKKLTCITPKILYLIQSIRNILVNLGYDEIRSWPLIKKNDYIPNPDNAIHTQNSINSKYPILRQSIIASLIKQSKQYTKYKVPNLQFFEIGKVFNLDKSKKYPYQENYSLGIFHQNKNQQKKDIKSLFQQLNIPTPKHNTLPTKNGYCIEFNLEKLKIQNIPLIQINHTQSPASTVELTSQIITLDANIELKEKQNPQQLLKKYSKIIGKNLWQIVITDIYHDKTKNIYRYTFHVSYYNINAKSAKSLHLKSFGLI